MARTQRFVIGNWKLYIDSQKKAKELFRSVARASRGLKKTSVAVCPPDALLGVLPRSASSAAELGAQNVSASTDPKQTGGSSVHALRDMGVSFVIVGHSERRARGEHNAAVAEKAGVVLKAGLTPVVCIGESERDSRGEYLSVLEGQLTNSLAGISRVKAGRVIIAYEPLWAIGKSAADAISPEMLHQTSIFIKKVLVGLYGRKVGTSIPILYGGSVEPSNAASFIEGGAVDGVLVGHASTDAGAFKGIITAVSGA